MVSPNPNPQRPGPPTSIRAQINALQQRGMSIPDRAEAVRFLSNVNFYRFREYLEPLVGQTASGNQRSFQTGTTFSDAVDRYDFDGRLRTLLLDAFNRIEVSIRTQWTYCLAYTSGGGERAHLNPSLFLQRYYGNLANLYQAYERHGKRTHRYDFADCPIWAIVEVMSFGQLSKWYGDTIRPVRRRIASHYGIDERILQVLLRHLAPIRNICAHHERLWDKDFITKIPVPKRMGNHHQPRIFFNPVDTSKVYNALVLVGHLTKVISDSSEWAQSLAALTNQYQRVPQNRMGFVNGWQNLDVWQP